MNKLPELFNEYSESRKQGFMEVKNAKDSGTKIVGIFCTYTPKEIIYAADAIAVGLCGMSNEPIEAAEVDLPRNLCPLIKSSYGFAITDTCPYFYFSDLLIGETTCDGKKKMYELLGKIKPMHVMELPQNYLNKDSFKTWKNEVENLKSKLENLFDIEISEENLREAIKICNMERKAKMEFYELGKLTPPAISGLEMLKVSYGSQFKMDKYESIDYMKNITASIKESYDKGERKISPYAPRILITGCPIGGATEKVIKSIEDNGAVVVCYENCGGIKASRLFVDEDKEPIEAIAERYLNIPCSVMTPNKERLNLISELIDEYKIDGVIEIILQACHTYNVESFKIKDFVNKEKNIPYLAIETDYSQNDIGQLNTRTMAFIEILK